MPLAIEIALAFSTGRIAAVSAWILETTFWRDAGEWIDSELWED